MGGDEGRGFGGKASKYKNTPVSATFLGPKWLNAISQGPKKSRFPGPNPLLLALIMDLHASKTLHTGPYKL